jgi:signal transduction histidine kinase
MEQKNLLMKLALIVLPASFAGRKSKEIYLSLFWLMNAFIQFSILSALFVYYRYFFASDTVIQSSSFLIAISLTLLGIFFFYRYQKITGSAVRLMYLGTFSSLVFAQTFLNGGLSFAVFWLLVTHIFGSYILRFIETLVWAMLIILVFSYLQLHIPNGIDPELFRYLAHENRMNFILVTLVLTGQISVYRWINELNEDEIAEKAKVLKSQSEENQTLLRVLVHDVANPLAAVTGYLDLEKRNSEAAVSRYIVKAVVAADKIKDIIEDVRGLQQFKDQKADFELKPFELNGSVSSTLFIFEEKMNKKNIRLKINLEHVNAMGNESLFSNQIFSNLLSNAIKFTPTGGTIEIETSKKENRALFRIKDSGIGIPQESIDKLFEIKTNSSRKGTDGEAGTGFGLPILKNVLDRMGGNIQIRSFTEAPNSGTEFIIDLPLS